MTDIARGTEIFAELMPAIVGPDGTVTLRDGGFADEIGELAAGHLFAAFWDRPGLSRRDRSIATISMLIALRSTDELAHYIGIGLRNGVTREELEELVYHSAGYVGYPAAAAARAVARRVL
ncbi:MAG: gamma-carboxymuconolactone decarboxylase subunit like protein [Aeromicrobium sp.]|nr:gamma-carboxymuconolactone decarboxylase subunit like protein [Aeromicrobium sp.]